jgi:hypothetical protein
MRIIVRNLTQHHGMKLGTRVLEHLITFCNNGYVDMKLKLVRTIDINRGTRKEDTSSMRNLGNCMRHAYNIC